MATTATNKQPLLIDRVFHYVVDTNNAYNSTLDPSGANVAAILVNAIDSDGALIEDLYCISRGGAAATINLYLSNDDSYLRPDAKFVGQLTSSATEAEVVSWANAPKMTAPVPSATDGGTASTDDIKPLQLRALYVPKGSVLWVARQSSTVLTDGPLVAAQGGWY